MMEPQDYQARKAANAQTFRIVFIVLALVGGVVAVCGGVMLVIFWKYQSYLNSLDSLSAVINAARTVIVPISG